MADAFDLIFRHTPILPAFFSNVDVSLRGHVLAEDILAEHDWPRTPTTNVDGYAVKASYKPGIYPVTTLSGLNNRPLPDQTVCRVNTGGRLPSGADAVLMVEDTLLNKKDDNGEELDIEMLASVDVGENVRRAGSDVKKGDVVLKRGDKCDILLNSFRTDLELNVQVSVYRRPVVAILSTGNEIHDLADESSSALTPDSNRPSLLLALISLGYRVIDLGIAKDTVAATKEALERGIQEADLIIATGGTSMGEVDLLKPVIERELNGTLHFGRVAMKPGMPTTFATLPKGPLVIPIFALPGNPASALVTFNIFVRPALHKMEGRSAPSACHLPRLKATTLDELRLDPRPEFHRVRLTLRDGQLVAQSTGGQRSSRTISLAYANGLIALPSGSGTIDAGAEVEVVLIGELA